MFTLPFGCRVFYVHVRLQVQSAENEIPASNIGLKFLRESRDFNAFYEIDLIVRLAWLGLATDVSKIQNNKIGLHTIN